jgi:geranylgeranyl diphosphate synthase, type I
MENSRIKKALLDFLSKKEREFGPVGSWGVDAIRRLKKFVPSGKMLRGRLVLLGYEIYGGSEKNERAALNAAAAMELFHSGLLIHDDIMDHDAMRRGAPAFHLQYKESGEAMGMCAGDLTFFLGYELTTPELLQLFSRELQMVGIAQMEDLFLGKSPDPGKDTILKMYRYKTGRYTFTLPLTAGALLAGKDDIDKVLKSLCDDLGILYQLKDDEIGLLGSTAETGKTEGSDIRENKKTLIRFYLFKHAPEKDTQRLQKIFGAPRVLPAELAYVRKLAKEYALPLLQKEIAQFAEHAAVNIENLAVSENYRNVFCELLRRGLSRKK